MRRVKKSQKLSLGMHFSEDSTCVPTDEDFEKCEYAVGELDYYDTILHHFPKWVKELIHHEIDWLKLARKYHKCVIEGLPEEHIKEELLNTMSVRGLESYEIEQHLRKKRRR